MTRTLMIMAGGTGGHVMPGLAVAAEMRARQWQVVWLGNPGSMESEIVPRHDIPMQWVRFGGLRGKGLLRKLLLPLNLLRAFGQSIVALRNTRPTVVLGMGGYVAFPGGMMAVLLNHPLVIHEQNSVAGLTNQVLARIADRVLQAFPGALKDAEHCGNPVRDDMLLTDDPAQRISGRQGPLRVLVVGGSQGARVLNETVPPAISALAPAQRPKVLHQCGRGNLSAVQAAYADAGVEAEVQEFIDDVAAAYLDADVVVCRAGAMTVAELAAVGVASILVPFPFAVDDHQTGNARYLSERGAAWLAPQPEFTDRWLADTLGEMSRERLAEMASAARAAALPQATRSVADACEAVARPVTPGKTNGGAA
ncbi:MAG: undecaprenyldiphospho-muramoylpentapeptide beta-N-acetylglucosaminyltransferase [Burkholderiaceae bacterium]